jgi:hypothetical protein
MLRVDVNNGSRHLYLTEVANGTGRIQVVHYERRFEPPAGPVPLGPWEVTWWKRPPHPLPQPPFAHGAHTTFARIPMRLPYGTVRQRDRDFFVIVPHWALIAATGVPPALWRGPSWLRRRMRKRKGLCLKCGYDVRASADKCPECGTPVPQRPPATERAAS